jgi:putative phage-type endonuclease
VKGDGELFTDRFSEGDRFGAADLAQEHADELESETSIVAPAPAAPPPVEAPVPQPTVFSLASSSDLIRRGVIRFADREAWLAARQSGIGGSEVAIILGASKWGTPYSLWARKTGIDPGDDNDNDVLEFGRLVEPLIADKYAQKTQRSLIDLGLAIRRHPTAPHLFVSHDRLIAPVHEHDGPGVLSIKSLNPYIDEDEWGDAEAPVKYEIQLQAELAASGFSWGSFAFLQWGKPLRWFDRDRNDAFITMMEAECAEFWRRVVEGDPPPIDGEEHTSEAIKRIYGETVESKVVTLPPESVEWSTALESVDEQLKALEKEKQALRNKLKVAIGDAEIGVMPNGQRWRYRTQHTASHSVSASTSRPLTRIKDSKKGGR